MTNKIALITGITGQDGSYLAELLLKKNYIVHGIIRKSSSFNTGRIDHIYNNSKVLNHKFFLHYGDLLDTANIINLIKKINPDEIYNLAAQSHVKVSFQLPHSTFDINSGGLLSILEAVKTLNMVNKCKIYQASTSELYGNSKINFLNENSPFNPNSPYSISKIASYYLAESYKSAYKMFICNGILFNHESPRRGDTFVSKKIIDAVIDYLFLNKKTLILGNLYSYRDWGHAKDYVNAMWLMLQQKKPNNYVIATGKSYSIKNFVEIVLNRLGVYVSWHGKGFNEYAIVNNIDIKKFNNYKKKNKIEKNLNFLNNYNNKIIKISKKYFRENEVNYLRGNALKAKKELKWKPKYNLSMLIDDMITYKIQKI